ncbi:MAG: FmdB family zinc ribbon protein [Planctomycetota bacterium]
MPLYEFVCTPCDKVFEVLFLSSNEKKKVTCPDCGGRNVAKKFSLFGTRTAGESGSFKGSTGGDGCGTCSSASCSSCK